MNCVGTPDQWPEHRKNPPEISSPDSKVSISDVLKFAEAMIETPEIWRIYKESREMDGFPDEMHEDDVALLNEFLEWYLLKIAPPPGTSIAYISARKIVSLVASGNISNTCDPKVKEHLLKRSWISDVNS